jgi:hypothetical protein
LVCWITEHTGEKRYYSLQDKLNMSQGYVSTASPWRQAVLSSFRAHSISQYERESMESPPVHTPLSSHSLSNLLPQELSTRWNQLLNKGGAFLWGKRIEREILAFSLHTTQIHRIKILQRGIKNELKCYMLCSLPPAISHWQEGKHRMLNWCDVSPFYFILQVPSFSGSRTQTSGRRSLHYKYVNFYSGSSQFPGDTDQNEHMIDLPDFPVLLEYWFLNHGV